MCTAPSNPPSGFGGYTWGFAPETPRPEEITPNISNYTISNTPFQLGTPDGGPLGSPKNVDSKVGLLGGKVRRTMFVVNDPFAQGTAVSRAHTTPMHKKHDVLSICCDKNCNCDASNTTPIFTTAGSTVDKSPMSVAPPKHFMTPIGPLQLTAEECNEILMKRAVAAASQVANNSEHSGHHGDLIIGMSSQKLGMDDPDDSQTAPQTLHCPKLEPISSSQVTPAIPKERPYSCDDCGKSFLLKHHLTTHSRVHTGERPHICVHCGKSFAHKHCLNTHLLLHSTERPYQCPECKKSFTLKHHLLTHSRVHSRERPFVCQECGRSFPLKRHLVTHGKFHAGERPYVCEECGESFAQKDHLVMHSRFHGSTNPFVCPDCGATFPRKFQLVNHGRLHGRVPHSCSICGKEFLQKRTMTAHMRLHTGDHPFTCNQCGESFRIKPELNQHNRLQHGGTAGVQNNTNNNANNINSNSTTGDRPGFQCRECGSAYNNREALALHLRLHAGDRTLVTDLCALTAALQPGHFLAQAGQQGQNSTATSTITPGALQIITSSGAVVSHGTTQTPVAAARIKNHFCSHCNKGFAAKHGLLQHNRRHPNGQCTLRTHVCEQCGKAFFQKNHLLLHQRQHQEHPRPHQIMTLNLQTNNIQQNSTNHQQNQQQQQQQQSNHQQQHDNQQSQQSHNQSQQQQSQISSQQQSQISSQQQQSQISTQISSQQSQISSQQSQQSTIISQSQLSQQNVSHAVQAMSQITSQLHPRDLVIGSHSTPVQISQVVLGQPAQVIKYEINIPQPQQRGETRQAME